MTEIVYEIKRHYNADEKDDVATCKTLIGAKTTAQDDIREHQGYEDVYLVWEFEGKFHHWYAEHQHLKYTIHRVEVLP